MYIVLQREKLKVENIQTTSANALKTMKIMPALTVEILQVFFF